MVTFELEGDTWSRGEQYILFLVIPTWRLLKTVRFFDYVVLTSLLNIKPLSTAQDMNHYSTINFVLTHMSSQ